MNIKKLKKSLVLMAKKLNEREINWSLGASMMLYLYGYDIAVNDIDLVIDEKDTDKVFELLKEIPYTYQEPNEKYYTKHFFSVVFEDVDYDFMIDFKVHHETGLYSYPFHVAQTIYIDNTPIYLASVEEWLLAYKMMGRTQKVELITNKRGK